MKRAIGLAAALAAAAICAIGSHAGADVGADQQAMAKDRCSNRLSIAFTGKTAGSTAKAEDLMETADFQERFSRFINSEFNSAPGATQMEDAPYFITKHVLEAGGPWSDVFLGKFKLVSIASNIAVQNDANGLGYFRTFDWYARYEGNEMNGIKLATAYRIMNNVVGLKLTASTNSPKVDQTATGRQAEGCRGCHYDGWFALDKVAAVLPKKGEKFNAYKDGPKEMLGGKQVDGDEALVTELVASENFSVNACRLGFKFLYAREDNRCDGPVLDRCVDAFNQKKTIQSALASIANEPGFCE